MDKLNVKAVFFDFDDTLQSRKRAYRLYCQDFLDIYFPDDDEVERENKLYEMEALVDGGYKDREVYFPELIELWQWEDHPPMQELYDSFNYDYGKRVAMLPGAVETIEELKRRGYILGMITNGVSSLQNAKLDTAGIRDLFDVCVVSGDIGIYKPKRGIFDEAVFRAGVNPEEAVYIGDHPKNDIQGALGAGMNVIRMNYGDFYGKGLNIQGVFATVKRIPDVLQFLPPLRNASPVSRKKAPSNPEEPKKARGRVFAVKLIAFLCAALMVGLAVLGSITGIFKEDTGEKTVLFSHMDSDQKASFVDFINKYGVFFENGYDAEEENFSAVLRNLQPQSPLGLYQSVFGDGEVYTDGADPAKRFSVGSECSGYVKIDKEDMQKLSDSLSQSLLTDENSRKAYYYDNWFYVGVNQSEGSQKKLYAALESSASVNTGDFYCVCGIFDNQQNLEKPDEDAELFKRYILVSPEQVGSSIVWSLKKISTEPLYSETGARISDEDDEDSIKYHFEKRTMKATTSDGKLFAVYYIEYPVFESDGIAQAACESVYSEKVSEFRTRVSNADSFYKAFIDGGGDDSLLPLTTNVIVEVTFNRNNVISLVDKTSVYDPTPEKKEETTEESTTESSHRHHRHTQETTEAEAVVEEERIILPTVQYAGYTFRIDSGEFMKKDELIGSDLNYAASLILEHYDGTGTGRSAVEPTTYSEEDSSYSSETTSYYGETSSAYGETTSYYGETSSAYGETTSAYGQTTSAYEQTIVDTDGIGTEIYNSGWAISEEGMDFYFVEEDGLLTLVTVPWGQLRENLLESE